MQKLDQKQKMQVVVLGVLAVGMFGTFIFRMMQVSPAAAHTQSASAVGQQTTSTASKSRLASTKDATGDLTLDAPPPTSAMRDPFIPGIADQAALEAYHKSLTAPSTRKPVASGLWNRPLRTVVAPLPSPENGLMLPTVRPAEYTATPLPGPAPVAVPEIAAPSWTVTGVVQGDDGKMAILRNGDARRMVRVGDMVDDNYRVVEVGQGHVRVAHGKDAFTLPLGGVKTAPAKAATETSTPGMPQANTPQDLGAPSTPVTGLPAGTVSPGGSTIDPNAVIKLPGGLTLPTVHLPAN